MVIDDSRIVLDRLVPSLNALPGIGVVLAGNSFAHAQKLLSDYNIDICLIDIHMPGKNGIELLQYIRQRLNNNKINVIIMSEDASEANRKLSQSAGADFFLDKFADFERITEIIEELLPGTN